MMAFTIAARELRSLFLSPLAWTVLAVVQLIMGLLFWQLLDAYIADQGRMYADAATVGVTENIVVPLIGNAVVLLLLIVPLLTMRLLSDERKSQTLPLLFSAPISMTEIVLGKFLGVMAFLMLMVLMVVLMGFSLLIGGDLDYGMFASALLGMVLLVASFVAAGLYMSTLTAQPVVAAISSFGLLFLLWVLYWVGNIELGGAEDVVAYISIISHFEALVYGVFDSSDVVYYLLFVSLFLVLSVRRLDADRLQH